MTETPDARGLIFGLRLGPGQPTEVQLADLAVEAIDDGTVVWLHPNLSDSDRPLPQRTRTVPNSTRRPFLSTSNVPPSTE